MSSEYDWLLEKQEQYMEERVSLLKEIISLMLDDGESPDAVLAELLKRELSIPMLRGVRDAIKDFKKDISCGDR